MVYIFLKDSMIQNIPPRFVWHHSSVPWEANSEMEFACGVFIRKCSQDQYLEGREGSSIGRGRNWATVHSLGFSWSYGPFGTLNLSAGAGREGWAPGLYTSASTRQRIHHMRAALGQRGFLQPRASPGRETAGSCPLPIFLVVGVIRASVLKGDSDKHTTRSTYVSERRQNCR